jgi:hypothetical protein
VFSYIYIYIYIYLIDVNLNHYQNNSRLSMDVGKLPNYVKSVSQLSLDLSLFSILYCSSLLCAVTTVIVHGSTYIAVCICAPLKYIFWILYLGHYCKLILIGWIFAYICLELSAKLNIYEYEDHMHC